MTARRILLYMMMLLCTSLVFAQEAKVGSYTFPKNGAKYYGKLQNGMPNGKGKTTFKSGDTYEGEYVNGKRQGYGVYTFTDGEKYEGNWHQDHQHGRGVYYFVHPEWKKYDGLWYIDYQQGFGTMYYNNGDVYEGEWMQDEREGKGKYIYSNGDVYDGMWKDGKKEGEGVLERNNGEIIVGIWKNDHLISLYQDNVELLPLRTGTGFAINEKYIATNYHVVENAQKIWVVGVGGDSNTKYKGTIVTTDKKSDLAIIKITDSRFKTLGIIPYQIVTNQAEMGENIFVLGYPLIEAMGDNIKLTTGIVSSKTGYQGDISTYQISAPIQPGNSGGPLFNNRGNVIGIVNAKLGNAENVNYAIKTLYLKNLVDSYGNITLSNRNTLQQQSLPDKVKVLKKYIYLIECY